MPSEFTELGKEFLKLIVQPKISFALWVVCFIVLVIPLPDFLQLENFRKDYGYLFSLVFLFSLVLWLAEVGLIVGNYCKEKIVARNDEKKTLKFLDTLNSYEAALMVATVLNQSQTLSFRTDVDEVDSLVSKGLLLVVPENLVLANKKTYSSMLTRPFTVPDFVWKAINKVDIADKLKGMAKMPKV